MIYLRKLKIESYKVLDNFELEFEEHEPLTVLLGINGSGKSTVLECLVWIFRAMHEKYFYGEELQVPFDFELDYQAGQDIVTPFIGSDVREVMLNQYHVVGKQLSDEKYDLDFISPLGVADDKQIIWDVPSGEELRSAIPNLVIYYSGLSENMRRIYEGYETQYLESSWGKAAQKATAFADVTALPIYYLQRDDLGLLLASLYAYEFNNGLDVFFEKTLNIKKPKGGSIVLIIRRPDYDKTITVNKQKIKPTQENFWNTEGVLLQFLKQIEATTTKKTIVGESIIAYGFSNSKWYELRQAYASERDVFALLVLLRANGMLGKAHVSYERDGMVTNYTNLSEGEQQLITVRALSELLVKDPTLLIFDEPNAYQHPSWQRELPETLAPLLEYASCVMTTHSPVLLTHLQKGTLVNMEKGVPTKLPGSPYGQRYADTLTDYMGLGSRPPTQEAAVEKVFTLLEEEDVNVAAVEKALKELRELVGADDPDVQRAETLLAFWEN